MCNFADDTTLNACSKSIEEPFNNLEDDIHSAIIWLENHFMKFNEDEGHLLILGDLKEHIFAKVGDELIWEGAEEKLVGITIDKNINFNPHLSILCKKVRQRVVALGRVAKLLSFHKRRLLSKSFIESKFSHCPTCVDVLQQTKELKNIAYS